MSEWDGKVVMSTPGGTVIEMSLGEYLTRKNEEIERLRAEVEHGHRAHKSACEGGDLLREEIKSLMAQIERMRAQNETLCASIAMIERAAAGAIYSQESIHAMALHALESFFGGKP